MYSQDALTAAPRSTANAEVRRRVFGAEVLLPIVVVVLGLMALVASGNLRLLEAFAYAFILAVAGFATIRATAKDPACKYFLPRLFIVAFGIRALAGIFIGTFLKDVLNYDSSTYEYYGAWYADYWHGIVQSPPHEYLPSLQLYSEIVGLQYFLTNDNIYIPDITNALIGSIVPCVIYDLVRRHFGGEKEARISAICGACLTAWIIWSAIAMRDIIIIFFVALVLREAVEMQAKLTMVKCIRLLVWLGCIYAFRPYVVMVLLLAQAISFTFTLASKPLARFVLGFVLLGVIGAAFFVGGINAVASQIIEEQTAQLESTRQIIEYKDDHAYGADVHYNSFADVVEYVPIELTYFLLGPFPWSYSGRQFVQALPEMASWYFILYYGIRGYLFCRRRSPGSLSIVTFFVVGALLLSAICGNFAESIRLRSMLSISLVTLAGAGWVHRKDKKSREVSVI